MLRQLAIAAVVTFVGGPSSPTVQLLVVFCILTLAAVRSRGPAACGWLAGWLAGFTASTLLPCIPN